MKYAYLSVYGAYGRSWMNIQQAKKWYNEQMNKIIHSENKIVPRKNRRNSTKRTNRIELYLKPAKRFVISRNRKRDKFIDANTKSLCVQCVLFLF